MLLFFPHPRSEIYWTGLNMLCLGYGPSYGIGQREDE